MYCEVDMSKDKYLCPCLKVTKKDIKDAIAEGAGSFKDIKKATKAGKGCGHCECKVKKYAKKQLKKKKENSIF